MAVYPTTEVYVATTAREQRDRLMEAAARCDGYEEAALLAMARSWEYAAQAEGDPTTLEAQAALKCSELALRDALAYAQLHTAGEVRALQMQVSSVGRRVATVLGELGSVLDELAPALRNGAGEVVGRTLGVEAALRAADFEPGKPQGLAS